MSRLKELYNSQLRTQIKEEFGITNDMLVPKLMKITISVGSPEAARDAKLLQNMADTLGLIAGQKAVITQAKTSVASFKIRKGMNVGAKVTLRGAQMWNFLDKLISLALPKVKDFRGIAKNGFDGRGNFNFGLTEQLIFPEVKYDAVMRIHGMNINIASSSDNDKYTARLLELLGFPFTKGK